MHFMFLILLFDTQKVVLVPFADKNGLWKKVRTPRLEIN